MILLLVSATIFLLLISLQLDICLNDQVPLAFQGLSASQAREKVIIALAEQAFLTNIESITHMIPYGERSGVPIQPLVTDQWFVDAKALAGPAIKAVEEGHIQFIPEHWTATYFEWLKNIQPWCISRQIWWGHQIPAWYGPDGHTFVADNQQDAIEQAIAYYGHPVDLTQDQDVLDTWFSSALWPFSTLGWPKEHHLLERYYPTDVLVTGFDIIFFWVARMIMMSLHFTGKIPFRAVYIHALVRDEKGQKMSKSKGNIINPLELVDSYGTDALRFTLAALAAPGRDVKLGKPRVEGYRNFITKIWNAARFLEMNYCSYNPKFDPDHCQHLLNRWIIDKIKKTSLEVYEHLKAYRFDLAAQNLYQFLWNNFCDIYIECLKPLLSEAYEPSIQEESKQTASWVLAEFLKIAHPFIPLVTEKLWQSLCPQALQPLITSGWFLSQSSSDQKSLKPIETALEVVTEIRSLRGLLNLPPTLKMILVFDQASEESKILQDHQHWIIPLARLEKIEIAGQNESAQDNIPLIIGQNTFHLKVCQSIDVENLRKILQNKIQILSQEVEHLQKKLQNTVYQQMKPNAWQEDHSLYQAKQQDQARLKSIFGF